MLSDLGIGFSLVGGDAYAMSGTHKTFVCCDQGWSNFYDPSLVLEASCQWSYIQCKWKMRGYSAEDSSWSYLSDT